MTPSSEIGVIGSGKLYGLWRDLNNIPHDLYDDTKDELPNISECENKKIYVAIGLPSARKDLYEQFKDREIISVIGPMARISDSSYIDVGAFINSFDCVNYGAKIGKGFIMGMNSVVDVNATIGDFVRLSSLVYIGHSAKVGSGCIINAGVTVLPDVEIGENVFVAAGSVVTHSFGSNITIAGAPARIVNGNNELHRI